VIVNATVFSGSSPSVGTVVFFAITWPNGKVATLSLRACRPRKLLKVLSVTALFS